MHLIFDRIDGARGDLHLLALIASIRVLEICPVKTFHFRDDLV